MREVACKSLGYNCGWKHVSRTEELLTDVMAVHLRDVHGVAVLTQEMVGKIKQAFSKAEPIETSGGEAEPLLKVVSCRDLGLDCNWKYIAQTEELIADGMAVHAREAHGIKEFSSEMATKVKNLAHEWKG
jgi:predicted small metal-binding protein